MRERREEGEEGGGREREEGGGHEEPRSPGWSLPWLFHLPVQGPDGVTMGLGSKTTWMTSQGAVSERGGTEKKGGAWAGQGTEEQRTDPGENRPAVLPVGPP